MSQMCIEACLALAAGETVGTVMRKKPGIDRDLVVMSVLAVLAFAVSGVWFFVYRR